MSQHEEVMRDMRRAAGLSVDSRSEEELVRVPERTAKFALKEVLDLSGMNDYQFSDLPKK